MSTLSITSWRPRRALPAPSARRVARSRIRARDRTRTRFATLTQPMRSTNSAPPQVQRRFDVADERVLERLHDRVETGVDEQRLQRRKLLQVPGVNRVHLL